MPNVECVAKVFPLEMNEIKTKKTNLSFVNCFRGPEKNETKWLKRYKSNKSN